MRPTETTATIAYILENWSACGEQWAELARTGDPAKRHEALYNAAACYARAGDHRAAFAALDSAIAAGMYDVEKAESDPDLVPLHGDRRWTTSLTEMKRELGAWEHSLQAPALRREILALVVEDQAARIAWINATGTEDRIILEHKVEATDKKSTAAMKAAIAQYGWPGKSVVGRDGAHGAWLLIQHADQDRALQRRVLARMKPLIEKGEVDAADYAFLYDRIAVAETGKQLYGTQFNGAEPFPIEDEAHIDERRQAMGMSTMAERRQVMDARLNRPATSK